MNSFRCLHCGQICDREDIWILPYIGQRCTACALLILGYYQCHLDTYLKMIVDKCFPARNRKEVNQG